MELLQLLPLLLLAFAGSANCWYVQNICAACTSAICAIYAMCLVIYMHAIYAEIYPNLCWSLILSKSCHNMIVGLLCFVVHFKTKFQASFIGAQMHLELLVTEGM